MLVRLLHHSRDDWSELSIDFSLGLVDLANHGWGKVVEYRLIGCQLVAQEPDSGDPVALLAAASLHDSTELLEQIRASLRKALENVWDPALEHLLPNRGQMFGNRLSQRSIEI